MIADIGKALRPAENAAGRQPDLQRSKLGPLENFAATDKRAAGCAGGSDIPKVHGHVLRTDHRRRELAAAPATRTEKFFAGISAGTSRLKNFESVD